MLQHKLLKITLITSFISLFLLSLNANADAISDKISACNNALNKADITAAISNSEEILKLQVNNRDGLLCKGRALSAQGKYSEALVALEQALNQSKAGFEQILAHIFIGNLHKDNQQFTQAITSYEKSIVICDAEKLPKFKRVNLNLIGDAHTRNNNLTAALASYQAGANFLMNDNERAESFEHIAATHNGLKQYNEAIEYQLKATIMQDRSGSRDDYANASLALGQMYTSAKDFPAAKNTYAKLIKFSQDNGSAYYEAKANHGLALTKAAEGDQATAKTMLDNALTAAKNMGAGDLVAEIEASIKKLN